jgi:hypothetical protein
VVYTEYALSSTDNRTFEAIDRIMAANEFDAQNLEQKLRSPKAEEPTGVPVLFKFLGLDSELWKA